MKRLWLGGSVVAALVAVLGCGGGSDSPAPEAPAPKPKPAAPAPATPQPSAGAQAGGAATISGTVRFEGEAPALQAIKMDADPGCAKKHSAPPPGEALVLGANGALANVFVQVRSGLPQGHYAVPTEPAVLNQEGCRYVPHVLGLMAGQPLKILNSDGLLHNIHALPAVNEGFNQAMPGSVTESIKTFAKPEAMFKIKCDVHPWMGAYVTVLDHPFFDVTGPDGAFSIANLPPGTYEIEAWHEKLGPKTASASVTGSDSQSIDFTFSR